MDTAASVAAQAIALLARRTFRYALAALRVARGTGERTLGNTESDRAKRSALTAFAAVGIARATTCLAVVLEQCGTGS